MTRNLKWYLAFSVPWSVVFFTALNWGLADPCRWPYVVVAGFTYGIGFWLSGFMLGKSDDQSVVRYSLGYAYAAVSNITSAAIGALWIIFFRPGDLWLTVAYAAIIAVFAALGVIQARRSIKGMSNESLFR